MLTSPFAKFVVSAKYCSHVHVLQARTPAALSCFWWMAGIPPKRSTAEYRRDMTVAWGRAALPVEPMRIDTSTRGSLQEIGREDILEEKNERTRPGGGGRGGRGVGEGLRLLVFSSQFSLFEGAKRNEHRRGKTRGRDLAGRRMGCDSLGASRLAKTREVCNKYDLSYARRLYTVAECRNRRCDCREKNDL